MRAAMRQAGIRITAQRTAMLTALARSDDHPDAAALHKRAEAIDPRVSVATVYRTVAVLEGAGILQRNLFETGSARFEIVSDQHHDHIVDLDSGQIVEFRSAMIERLQTEVALKLGYDVIHHRLELYCRKRSV